MSIQLLLDQGLSLLTTKQFNAAEKVYQQVLELDHANVAALHVLGVLSYQFNDLLTAEKYFNEVLAIKPDHVEALHNLSNVVMARGDVESAITAIQKAISYNVALPQLHHQLACLYLAQQQYIAAEQSAATALVLNPSYIRAFITLGLALQGQSKLAAAERAYLQAQALDPNNAAAHNNLGNVYKEQGKLAQAAAAYQKAYLCDPTLVEPQYNYACVESELGNMHAAIKIYRNLIARHPGYYPSYVSLATAYKHIGKKDHAIKYYKKALTLDPNDTYVHRCIIDLQNNSSLEYINELEQLLITLDANSEKAVQLLFALAKAYEDKHDYSKAFDYLQQGNSAYRRSYQYDVAMDKFLFKQLAEIFNVDTIAKYQGYGVKAITPIFVVGMPRSGTSLIEKILASHSQVVAAGEIYTLDKVINQQFGDHCSLLKNFTNSTADTIYTLGQQYLELMPMLSLPKQYVVNKMPANFKWLGLIKIILPNAKIIHCLRHPFDTCFSCYKQLFTAAQPFCYDLQELAEYYLAYNRLMDHWRRVMPNDFIELRYEDMVYSQAEQTERLLHYCGLPWEATCLNFYTTKQTVKTASASQVIQPIYTDSVEKWKCYADKLAPLAEVFVRAHKNQDRK